MTSRLSKTGSILLKQQRLLNQQSQLRQQSLQLQPQTLWFKVKGWFDHSETILLARSTVLAGFIVGTCGALDFSPLLGLDVSTGFNKNQIMWLGGIMVFQGVVAEMARRRNSPI